MRTALPGWVRAAAPTSGRAEPGVHFFWRRRAGRMRRKPQAQDMQQPGSAQPLPDGAPATGALYPCSFAVPMHRVVFHRIQDVLHVAVDLVADLGVLRIALRGIWLPEKEDL